MDEMKRVGDSVFPSVVGGDKEGNTMYEINNDIHPLLVMSKKLWRQKSFRQHSTNAAELERQMLWSAAAEEWMLCANTVTSEINHEWCQARIEFCLLRAYRTGN